MLPENFSEKCIRVYCKRVDVKSVDAAKECFRKACADLDLIPPKVRGLTVNTTVRVVVKK